MHELSIPPVTAAETTEIMQYCKICISCDTRPNLVLDGEGVCNACRNHALKKVIDWESRESEFRTLAENARGKTRGYDCLIAVSGGKDSTWQTVKCLEYGLTPLAFSYRPPRRTAIGQRNLDNLISLGVDHIDYTINPDVEARFLLKAFESAGNPGVPMHRAIYNISRRLACRFDIPLVVHGEDSAFEYGGARTSENLQNVDEEWLKKFAVTGGVATDEWLDEDLTEKKMTALLDVEDTELHSAGVANIFLGYYFDWDPEETAKIAVDHGMAASEDGPRTGYYAHTDLDDELVAVHHYIKWFKFGFTRMFDNLSIEIRHGRMTRDEALEVLRVTGDQAPHEDIATFCEFTGIAAERFQEICEGFRNTGIWHREGNIWKIDGFLIDDWDWTTS